jgi:hypothetical protein
VDDVILDSHTAIVTRPDRSIDIFPPGLGQTVADFADAHIVETFRALSGMLGARRLAQQIATGARSIPVASDEALEQLREAEERVLAVLSNADAVESLLRETSYIRRMLVEGQLRPLYGVSAPLAHFRDLLNQRLAPSVPQFREGVSLYRMILTSRREAATARRSERLLERIGGASEATADLVDRVENQARTSNTLIEGVQRLLRTTADARRAAMITAVVAATIALVAVTGQLAGIGAADALLSPARATAVAGCALLGAILIGYAMFWLAHVRIRCAARTLAVFCAVAATNTCACLAAALFDSGNELLWLSLSGGSGLVALLLFALVGDFGATAPSRR